MEKEDMMFRALMAYNDGMKRLGDVYRIAVKRLGMSECAFWILYTLRTEEGPFTQTEICEFLREPKQTVNSALKKLEAEGCLSLGAGEDMRSKSVRLTPEGERLAERTCDRVAEAETSALGRLSDSERGTLVQLLRRFSELLEEELLNGENQREV